jgi:hypothetical protein
VVFLANSQRGTSKINYLLRYQRYKTQYRRKSKHQIEQKHSIFNYTYATINVILSLAFVLHKVKHKYNKRLVNKYIKKIF